MNKTSALYLHVPFCKSICFYCDFCHEVYSAPRTEAYLNAIQKELETVVTNKELKTIYIGGGTPSALSTDDMNRLLTLLDPYTKSVKEYTIEVNPETIDESKVQCMKAHGINRISMGLQSTNPKELKMMNRHHSFTDVKRAVSLFRYYGIFNISLDILYSLPEQTMQTLEQTITDVLTLDVVHLSAYSLTIEENSVFGKRGLHSLDLDREADMYEYLVATLKKNGYEQYEISNFAKDKAYSMHNLSYWHYDNFYGIGPGASGKTDTFRYDHTRSLTDYLKDPLSMDRIPLSKADILFEAVMMGLRLKEGISLQEYEEKYQVSLLEYFSKPIQINKEKGYLVIEDGYLKCTEKGYPLLNEILVEFL